MFPQKKDQRILYYLVYYSVEYYTTLQYPLIVQCLLYNFVVYCRIQYSTLQYPLVMQCLLQNVVVYCRILHYTLVSLDCVVLTIELCSILQNTILNTTILSAKNTVVNAMVMSNKTLFFKNYTNTTLFNLHMLHPYPSPMSTIVPPISKKPTCQLQTIYCVPYRLWKRAEVLNYLSRLQSYLQFMEYLLMVYLICQR